MVASIKGELIRGSKLIYVLAPQTDVILHYRIRECVLEVGGQDMEVRCVLFDLTF